MIESSLHSLSILNQHKNGETFADNTSDVTTDFVALIGEKVRAISQINLTWWSAAGYSDTWVIGPGYILRQTGSFEDDGFLVGQSFQFYTDWAQRFTATQEFTADIDTITQNGKYLTFTVTGGSQSTGGSTPIVEQTDQGIWIDLSATPAAAPDALFFRFTLQPNGDSFSNVNISTLEAQGWYGAGLTSTPSTLSPEGVQIGWKTGQCTAEKEATVYEKNHVTYKVTHDFTVFPFWEDGWYANIQAGTLPPLYQGGVSIAYRFEAELRHGLLQTTSAKVASFTGLQGITGFFGESFGGLQPDYSVGAATYTNIAGDNVTAIQKNAKTTIAFTLKKTSSSFASGQKVGVYISYLPPASEYQNTLTEFDTNLMYDNIFHTEGAAETAGTGVLKRCEATLNAGDLHIEIDVEYTTDQRLRIGTTDYYAVWVIVEDSGLTAPNSDRSVLMVDTLPYLIDSEITGLTTWNQLQFFQHEQDKDADTPLSSANVWNEDGLLVQFDFSIDTTKDAEITAITFELVAYNATTGDDFSLDSYPVDLSGVVVSQGVQQIEVDTTRGYILKDDDQFNLVQITTGPLSGDDQHYTGFFAQKVKWQDWLLNLGVNTVFYDNSEPNNNLNFLASNYSNLEGYEIRFRGIVETTGKDMNGSTGIGRDIGYSGDLDTFDYGVSDETWTATIYTLDPDTLTDLGGAILGSKNTLFRIIWNQTTSSSTTDLYAIHRLQEAGAIVDNIQEMSSVNLPPPGQALIPKDGETLITLATVGSDIYSECLIDYTQIDPSKTYNLSGRVERFTAGPNFTTAVNGCNLQITSTYSGTPTSIQYNFYLGVVLVDTVASDSDPYYWQAASLFANDSIRIVQTITDGGGIVTEDTIVMPAFSGCYIAFNSNLLASDTFDPTMVDGTAETYWRMPDKVVRAGGTQSVLGSDADFNGTTQEVRAHVTDWTQAFGFTINSDKMVGSLPLSLFTVATTLEFQNNAGLTGVTFPTSSAVIGFLNGISCNITGTLDLSPFSNLAGRVEFTNNSNLTAVNNPTSSQSITRYRFDNCGLVGTIDVSTLTGLKELLVNGNSGLTGITTGTHSSVFTSFWAHQSGLSGTLVLAGLTGLGGDFRVHTNSSLTGISFPSSSQAFTNLWAYSCNLTGNIDLSSLTGLSGKIHLYSNPLLTSITNPSSTATISRYRAQNCNITGTFDCSGLSDLRELLIFANSNLTGITNPTHSNPITSYWAYNCNLTGNIDLSTLTGLGGSLRLYGNSLLTSVTNPTSSESFSEYDVHDCDLTGTLNVSGLTGLAGNFDCSENSNLTGLTFPASSGTISTFDAFSCNLAYFDITNLTFDSAVSWDASNNNMTAAEVNKILVNLDSTVPVLGTGSISIGGTNAAPNTTSGGFNGSAAVTSLAAKGYTVITS